MFAWAPFRVADAGPLAAFLNRLRRDAWSLTSLGYARRPEIPPAVTPDELVAASQHPRSRGPFVLRCDERIVSTIFVDDRDGDGRVMMVSRLETDPEFQQRGTFFRHLGAPLVRQFCQPGIERFEATTWTFNRKGIPLYKRAGFRAVPGTWLAFENYLPAIVNHPGCRAFFALHDPLRTLRCRRSYGYDDCTEGEMSVFVYEWEAGDARLRVAVDWARQRIASIERDDWALWVHWSGSRIVYRVENRSRQALPVVTRARIAGQTSGLNRLDLAPRAGAEGAVASAATTSAPADPTGVEFDLGGEVILMDPGPPLPAVERRTLTVATRGMAS
jgi:RimJ/RimL family protein N-acetyltransferase